MCDRSTCFRPQVQHWHASQKLVNHAPCELIVTVNHVNKARDFEAWVECSSAVLPEQEVEIHHGIPGGTIVESS